MSPSEESSLLSVSSRPVALPFRRVARERFPVLYRIVRDLCRPALSRWFDLSIEGLERLPAGPFILAANHHNYLDGVVLGVAVPRPISFIVMPRVYHASPLHPAFHRHIGSIPVNLSRPEPGAIKRALRALDAGHIVGIFPEGPFSREGRLVPGQPGAAALALHAGVPVVPTAVLGTFEAMRGRRFYLPRRHPLGVRFGAPLALPGPRRHGPGRAERVEVTRRIMAEIDRLLARAHA
jgi:1-acyl-sn-glycerol-3-phosphate acyltransferase